MGMTRLEDKLLSWPESARGCGETIFKIILPHLGNILLQTYKSAGVDPDQLPSDNLQREERKLKRITTGDFSSGYFVDQAKISRDIASQIDYVDYLVGGYAPYAAGLANILVDHTRWKTKSRRDELMTSLLRSILSDIAVAMSHFFAEEQERLDRDRAQQQALVTQEAVKLQEAVNVLGDSLRRMAAGDLECQINVALDGRYEGLRADFNASLAQLSQTMRTVNTVARSIDEGSKELAQGTTDLSRRTEQQAAMIEETSAALSEITSNVRASAATTQKAKCVAVAASAAADGSAIVVEKTEAAMRRIEESSHQISNIIGAIDQIAFQTNLLALNAGVEAARAGEAGKGFAVVAQEVRELAQRSATAAKEIKGLIERSSAEVGNGVNLVNDTGTALRAISDYIVQMNEQMDVIAISSRDQSSNLDELSTAVRSIEQTTQKNAAMVEESTAVSCALAEEVVILNDLMSQFRIGTFPAVTTQAA